MIGELRRARSWRRPTDDIDWIAEGLSSLGFFLEPCLHGREPAEQAIQLFFERYGKRGTPAYAGAAAPAARPAPAAAAIDASLSLDLNEPAAGGDGAIDQTIKFDFLDSPSEVDKTLKMDAPTQPPAASQAPRPSVAPVKPRAAVDAELLGIFLEEAGEVLQTIDDTVPTCRAEPSNLDALTTIRRGFHTLKGSGRMVGLIDLGEVAWEIERLMNGWLEQKRPANAGLLDLISVASAAFAKWVDELRGGGLQGEVDGAELVAMVKRRRTRRQTRRQPAPARRRAGTRAGRRDRLRPRRDAVRQPVPRSTCAKRRSTSPRWRASSPPGARRRRLPRTSSCAPRIPSPAARTPQASARSPTSPTRWRSGCRSPRRPTSRGDAVALKAALAKLEQMVAAVTGGAEPGKATQEAHLLRELTGRLKAAPPPPMDVTQRLRAHAPAGRAGPDAGCYATACRRRDRRRGRRRSQPGARSASCATTSTRTCCRSSSRKRQEIMPQIGADLRDWKASPADDKVIAGAAAATCTR